MKIHRLLFEKLVFGNLTQPGAWQCVRGNGNISFATQSVFVLKRPHRIGTHRSSVGHIRKKHVSVSYLLFLVKAHIDCFLIVGEL